MRWLSNQIVFSKTITDPEILAGRVAEDLDQQLDLPITMYGPEESKFFAWP